MTRVEPNIRGKEKFVCRCECGGEKAILASNLYTGLTRSCGCLQRERPKETRPEKHVWKKMKERCADLDDPNYGGRGITVCAEWSDFEQFYTDMGPRPSEHYTIERKNNEQGYSKENCCWATQSTQQKNKRNNKLNWELARMIRSSDKSAHQLARELSVAVTTVSRVRQNLNWRE